MIETRVLGRTGLAVSRLGFGGAPLGIANYLSEQDRDSPAFRSEALHAVGAAVAGGVTYFDTAASYGAGRSEALLGEALEPHRGRVVIATKFKAPEGATPEGLTEGLRASLDHLRTRHVDVLQLHGLHFDDALADRLLASCVPGWLAEMRARGLIRFSGITAETSSGALERLLRSGHFDVLQAQYSAAATGSCDRRWGVAGIIPLARSLGLGVCTMRSLGSGFLLRLLRTEFPDLDAGRLARTLLRFALSTPELDCVLLGMQTEAEVRENLVLAAADAPRLDLDALFDRGPL